MNNKWWADPLRNVLSETDRHQQLADIPVNGDHNYILFKDPSATPIVQIALEAALEEYILQ